MSGTGLAKSQQTRMFVSRCSTECEMPKLDRRTERTRAALMSAFVNVLLSEGYDAVTVERVAEQANVGRSTFYMHYKSKEEILRESMKRPSSVLAVIVGGNIPNDPIVFWMDHFYEQRRRNHIFFGGPVRTIWAKCLAELIEPRLASLVRHARGQPILPLPLIALQIAETQLALIGAWLNAKPGTKAEAVAEALIQSTRATVAALLRVKPETSLLIPGEKLQFRKA
jgi:AcrR family transcriptional regulator